MPAPNPSELDPQRIAALKQAFHGNDAAKVREILTGQPELKPLVNAPVGPFDSPAILHARSREMLDVLLDVGADINAKSQWWAGGFGLLHGCNPELATYAIQRGAIVDAHAAARLGLIDKLRELLRADAELVRARGGDGQTPLHFASTIEIADLLLDHGADIDVRDVDHESTPVQWMIGDRTAIARHLIQRGCRTDILLAAALGDAVLVEKHLLADPESIRIRVTADHFPMINPKAGGTIYQWTLGWYVSPHEVARKFGHEDIYRMLMDRSPVEVRLLAACWASDESTVQALLGANPGLVSRLSEADRRHVALAARNNNTAAVRVMLAAGWPVDALGQHRATPLHWAAFHGNAEMAREILRHQPPLEVTDADPNATPLGWAIHGSEHGWYCRTGNYAGTVEALLQAGAKLGDRKLAGTAAVQEVLRRHPATS
ncbi:MAG TPA: ankyrin repeat domain-containing protein [Candidatus Saccharimonadales bacterium]|nr:ankyrin repeat domain-containing protein [Candidatus Saccharimonadales bacterium]